MDQANGVANKRSPQYNNTALIITANNFINIYLTELLYKATIHGKTKTIINKCQMRKRRPLDWLVMLYYKFNILLIIFTRLFWNAFPVPVVSFGIQFILFPNLLTIEK